MNVSYFPGCTLKNKAKDLDAYAYLLFLSILDDAVAKLGMVGGVHLLYVKQHTMVTDDIVRQIMHIMNGTVITYITRVYTRVGNTYRQAKIMILQGAATHTTDAHSAIKLIVLNHAWFKTVGHPHRIPRRGCIIVLYQTLYLITAQMTPPTLRYLYLTIADIVLIFSCRNIFGVNPSIAQGFGWK